MSTVGPGAKRARAAASFITSTGTPPRSKGAPEVASLISSGVPAKRMTSLCPVAPSKRAPSSFRLAVMEPPARTVSSAARAAAGGRTIARASMAATSEALSMVVPRGAAAASSGPLRQAKRKAGDGVKRTGRPQDGVAPARGGGHPAKAGGNPSCFLDDAMGFAGAQPILHLRHRSPPMCRNIKTLFNFEPPASEDEIRASALQFVRKLSGFTAPSQQNAAAFDRAVEEAAEVRRRL